eukprot:2909289-Prymnesium_polylepis.1
MLSLDEWTELCRHLKLRDDAFSQTSPPTVKLRDDALQVGGQPHTLALSPLPHLDPNPHLRPLPYAPYPNCDAAGRRLLAGWRYTQPQPVTLTGPRFPVRPSPAARCRLLAACDAPHVRVEPHARHTRERHQGSAQDDAVRAPKRSRAARALLTTTSPPHNHHKPATHPPRATALPRGRPSHLVPYAVATLRPSPLTPQCRARAPRTARTLWRAPSHLSLSLSRARPPSPVVVAA